MEDLGLQIHPSQFRVSPKWLPTPQMPRSWESPFAEGASRWGGGIMAWAKNGPFCWGSLHWMQGLWWFFNGEMWENPLSVMEIHGNCWIEKINTLRMGNCYLKSDLMGACFSWGINLTPRKSTFSGNRQNYIIEDMIHSSSTKKAWHLRIPPAEDAFKVFSHDT